MEIAELEGYLVELIDRAGRPADRPVTSALADILARAARRLMRQACWRRWHFTAMDFMQASTGVSGCMIRF